MQEKKSWKRKEMESILDFRMRAKVRYEIKIFK